MRHAQLVIGPAGSGKSTYCTAMQQHGENTHRVINIVNLDPAAENFDYKPLADIRDLIHVEDAMEDEQMHWGPNGGLIFCMEFLLENLSWLAEQLGGETDVDDDYIIFDCPGQIELYTHLNVMRKLTDALEGWNFRICTVFLLDSHFMTSTSSFISGAMACLSAMACLETPFVSVLSKIDLLSKKSKKQLDKFMQPDVKELMAFESSRTKSKWFDRHQRLTEAVGRVLEDYSLIKFLPLNLKEEESVIDLINLIDMSIQYGEDGDVKVADFDPPEEEDDGYDGGSS